MRFQQPTFVPDAPSKGTAGRKAHASYCRDCKSAARREGQKGAGARLEHRILWQLGVWCCLKALQQQLEILQSTKASVKAAEPAPLPPLKHGAKIRELRLKLGFDGSAPDFACPDVCASLVVPTSGPLLRKLAELAQIEKAGARTGYESGLEKLGSQPCLSHCLPLARCRKAGTCSEITTDLTSCCC